MAVLAALRSVDWVVPFDAPTPEALICAISPQILVKGGDYSPEQIAGAQCVHEAGGEVRIIEFVDGHSTTSTIARIRALS
jgi:D-beta-D-heptose 7-phosphate kinase/D-beta-D-heptose 1-phosphate adenosyltransferase